MERLLHPLMCRAVTDKHPLYFTFAVEEWLAVPENYALIAEDNIGFAEKIGEGIYTIHFCFNTAKGRKAIQLARTMLLRLYKERDVKTVIGSIDTENKKAIWVVRQLGLTSLGSLTTHDGEYEVFYEHSGGVNGVY